MYVPSSELGGGAHSPVGEGLGETQFRRLEKKLSTLPTLWFEANVQRYFTNGAATYKKPTRSASYVIKRIVQ